jgi:hypothetical protein
MVDDLRPRSFFLNEQHELTRGEKEGGGGIPRYAPINWETKGRRIQTSLAQVKEAIDTLPDPAKDHHYFLIAKPDLTLKKLTSDRRRAPNGDVEESTEYSGKDSRVFSRLGMDLLGVGEDGSAMVHATPERFEQLGSTAAALPEFGIREQVRWAKIESFELIPLNMRIDEPWVRGLRPNSPSDAVVELQPLLTTVEVDQVMRAIADLIRINAPRGQLLRGTGTDFSGRQWLRGSFTPEALLRIAETFISVQSLHSPLISEVHGGAELGGPNLDRIPIEIANLDNLPSVAVVDTGVPRNHAALGLTVRRGAFTTPLNAGGTGRHGSFVASRIVFGDQPRAPQHAPNPTLRYFDVNVALGPNQIDHKELLPALEAVAQTAPDVRVFNLSFDGEPLVALQPVKRQEELILAQDVDNFIFQYDVLIVVAAGNSRQGIIPNSEYPNHHTDPSWQLGAFAQTFNSLTCGSYVSHLSASGLVRQMGWPSPFCRVGPGLAKTPKPDFSAAGGNTTENYGFAPGVGVWGLDEYGNWREGIGTSYAAPLLARQAAFAMRSLENVCEPGARPYACTVKAFLALSAKPPVADAAIATLARKTLGYGTAGSERLRTPSWNSAVLIWQGVLDDKSDLARVQIPVPKEWLLEAAHPKLRLFVAADLPVNAAVSNVWASRKVNAKLRTNLEARAVFSKSTGTSGYSLLRKEFDLSRIDPEDLESDLWILELSYEEAADYLPSMTFPTQQRLAFAAELLDAGEPNESPQPFLQSMTFTRTMTRLSVPPAIARTPIVLRIQT